MDKETIDRLKGLAYTYCLEKRTNYMGGQQMTYNELNKTNYEKLSGFVNWIEMENSPQAKSTQPAQTKSAKGK